MIALNQVYNLILVPVIVIATIYITKFLIKYAKYQITVSAIPTPPGKFILGNMPFIFLSTPDNLFLQLREFANDYFPIFRFSSFYVTIVNLLEPHDLEILLSSTKHLTKSRIYTFLNRWLGTGLLTSTGTKWHTRRKILTPAFHFSILQQFVTIFNEETEKLVAKLTLEAGKDVSIIPPITHFTLQSIGETAMGLDSMDESAQTEYKKAIYDMGWILFRRLAKPWYRIQQIYDLSSLAKEEIAIVDVLHSFSNNVIKKREEERKSNAGAAISAYSKKKRLAMLDLLLEAKSEGSNIDNEGIREEVDTFMFEGHDTTSMAITFILLCLANHPEIQEKVFEELTEVLGSSTTPSCADLQELKFTERVIKESLRLFPSVPLISRYAGEDFKTYTGYTVPKGTIVHVHIFDIHRSPHLYPDPLKFDPDRFLPENVTKRHPFAYIPFSAGPRNCIGQRFALFELKAVVCGIVRKFLLEKVQDMHDVKFRADLVLRPINDVRVKFVLRN